MNFIFIEPVKSIFPELLLSADKNNSSHICKALSLSWYTYK